MRGAALRTTTAVLHLACAVLLASCRPDSPEQPPEPVVETVSKLAEQRWVEPRLSVATVYGPCTADCDPDELLCEPECLSAGSPDSVRHNPAAPVSSWLEPATESSAEKHAEALLALADPEGLGSHRQTSVEKAVQMLETLAKKHPSDARIRSDLAAAFFVRAQRGERPADLVRALEAAEEAVGLDQQLPATVFNQALAHEALALRPTAQQAWKLYLELDPSSGWADEARQRLEALDVPERSWPDAKEELNEAVLRHDTATVRRLVDRFRTAARRHVEDELLPAWGEAFTAGDKDEASRQLDTARQVADALAELGGDTLLVESVAAIDTSSAESLPHFAAGHRAYGEGIRRVADADPFEAALRVLSRAGSPFQDWPVVNLATCHYRKGEYREALRLLEPLRRRAGARRAGADRRHASLLGHASWITALSETFLTRPLEALGSYQEALALFQATGEREHVVNVHARLADLLATLGEKEEAWKHRYRALRGRAALQRAGHEVFLLGEASMATLELALPASALLLQDEGLRVARESRQELVLVEALLKHTEASLRSGSPDQALRDLTELSRVATEPALRSAAEARILELEGDVRSREDPLRAVEALTEALRKLPETYLPYQARFLLKRARAFRKAGLLAEASADVNASVALLEEEWEQVLARRRRGEHEEIWPAYFVHRRETFDLVIELLVEQGQPELAFNYAERARTRELLDLVADLPSGPGREKPFRPRTAAAVREALPAGQVLVEYALLDDRLLIWEVRRARSQLHVREVSRARLDELVRVVDRAFNERDTTADAHGALAKLHDLLLQPWLAALKDDEELVFVPDGPLHGVPFAALRDGASGRFLVEDHVLSVAPSATLYLFSLQRDRELQSPKAPTALLVGNPAMDRELFPDLDDLPGAAFETRLIASYYPGSLRLEDAEATKPRLLAEIGRHGVVHFAGHAIPNLRSPHRSGLVLAPSAGESGILYAEELLNQDLGRTRLVVLSACSTAGGKAIGSLTVTGLVRPLLGAGVPAVVGTLWDVKSGATPQLLDTFHRHLSAGESAARALRLAQLEMLRGNLAQRSVKSWAPFQVIGAASFHDFRERNPP